MSNEKIQDKYRIKSARATWHDYSGGVYFITVCTKDHEHFFGEIIDTQMQYVELHATSLQKQTIQQPVIIQLSPIGLFLAEKIKNITNHCPYAEILLFVVMPNHWHAIILIDGNCRDVACNVSTRTDKNEKMVEIAKRQSLLCFAVRSIKSAVTKFAHENGIDFAWQTRFHDHIIRDQNEMNRIADYIENNVANWNTDCYNENNRRDGACPVSTNE